jgi:hypothetical protein
MLQGHTIHYDSNNEKQKHDIAQVHRVLGGLVSFACTFRDAATRRKRANDEGESGVKFRSSVSGPAKRAGGNDGLCVCVCCGVVWYGAVHGAVGSHAHAVYQIGTGDRMLLLDEARELGARRADRNLRCLCPCTWYVLLAEVVNRGVEGAGPCSQPSVCTQVPAPMACVR